MEYGLEHVWSIAQYSIPGHTCNFRYSGGPLPGSLGPLAPGVIGNCVCPGIAFGDNLAQGALGNSGCDSRAGKIPRIRVTVFVHSNERSCTP